ncbi:hypothetical protein BDR04DRAFT_1162152 [Suillus decipiens]|nr:hypothetical protein BDR04DRAFT_1162152 [Suillus decipiens]
MCAYWILLLPDSFTSDVEEAIHIIAKHQADVAQPPSPHQVLCQVPESSTTSTNTHSNITALTGLLAAVQEVRNTINTIIDKLQKELQNPAPIQTPPSSPPALPTVITINHPTALYKQFTYTHEEVEFAESVGAKPDEVITLGHRLTELHIHPLMPALVLVEVLGPTSPSTEEELTMAAKAGEILTKPPIYALNDVQTAETHAIAHPLKRKHGPKSRKFTCSTSPQKYEMPYMH